MRYIRNSKTPYDQHFLISNRALRYIESQIKNRFAGANIFEIGPGTGAVTEILLRHCNRLLAVEIDRSMERHLNHLKARYADKLAVLYDDAHKIDLNKFDSLKEFDLIFSSLPYSIASQLIFKYIEESTVKEMLFIMQREMAEKIVLHSSDRTPGVFSAKMQLLIKDAKMLMKMPRHVFKPNPKVDSCLVEIRVKDESIPADRLRSLYRFLECCFRSRRQLLKNNLFRALANAGGGDGRKLVELCFSDLDISIDTRAEELSLSKLLNVESYLERNGVCFHPICSNARGQKKLL